ncbi:hypothetical protein [Pedobacter sp. Leaf170]|uniref:hypothetical protein n=1 Tax=Pedobacter sp. Leaf170 TaxID=2876558 RepID=UPI001E4B6868|nr:hypothetical protein [Pedobacter sp. Leaf170]
MKNTYKFGFLALVISLTVVACGSEKKSDEIDTTLVDSSTIAPPVTTSVDTNTVDTVAIDSTKKPL